MPTIIAALIGSALAAVVLSGHYMRVRVDTVTDRPVTCLGGWVSECKMCRL